MASTRTRAPERAGLLAALCLAACLAAACAVTAHGAPPEPERVPRDDEPAWVARRPAVLGLQVEQLGDEERFRLVHVDGDPPVVQGSLVDCEAALLDALRERWGAGLPNVPLPTLGAKQFWADRAWHAGWRVQENVLSGHGRLLDPDDVRRAWGTLEACRTELEVQRVELGLAPTSERLVVLVHGLGRSKASFARLQRALFEDGAEVLTFSYPSTRRSLAEHGEQLREVLGQLHGVRTVSFVTHSLGGIVVREALSREGSLEGSREGALPEGIELGRVVMLAPPSRGSELARMVGSFLPFAAIMGPSLADLSGDLTQLPAPPCEFGVVAGASSDGDGYNPWLDGDDDGVVTVDETVLEGAADRLVVNRLHTLLMDDAEVVAATLRFLASGRFDGRTDANDATDAADAPAAPGEGEPSDGG